MGNEPFLFDEQIYHMIYLLQVLYLVILKGGHIGARGDGI